MTAGLYLQQYGRALRPATKQSVDELRAISREMRERKVNGGKRTSPTLIAWADRIDAALARIEK